MGKTSGTNVAILDVFVHPVAAKAGMGVEYTFMNCHLKLGPRSQKDRLSMFGKNKNLETILHWP